MFGQHRLTWVSSSGESVPLAGSIDSTDNNYLETKNIGLQGTHCASGTCTGIVVSIGNRTVFGRIAKLTNEPKTGLTTLEREVLNFVYVICSIMITMIILVIILWYVRDLSYGITMLTQHKGCMAEKELPGLDQRPNTDS